MPSVQTIIDVAKVSQYLADNAIAMGQEQDKQLANKLYLERNILEWAYGFIPNDENIEKNANYLYSMCGAYGIEALGIIGQGSGGIIPTPSGQGYYQPTFIDHTVTAGESGSMTIQNDDWIGLQGLTTLSINQQVFQLNVGFLFNSAQGELDFDLSGSSGNQYTLQTGDTITANGLFKIVTP